MFDPLDFYGIMPEIPTHPAPRDEPAEKDITAAHIVGCLYAIVACVVLFLSICMIILFLRI